MSKNGNPKSNPQKTSDTEGFQAGKLLIESMVECRDIGIPIFRPQDLSNYW